MQKILIWTVIIIAGCTGVFFLFQYYNSTRLIGDWTAIFQNDLLKDDRLSIEKIKLTFDEKGGFVYQVNMAAEGMMTQTNFGGNGSFSESSKRKIQKTFRGTYQYIWPRVYIKFPGRYIETSDSYDPFIIEQFTTDPGTGEKTMKISALVDFLGDRLALQGTPLKEAVRFSNDDKGAYNNYVLQPESDNRPTVIRRTMISNPGAINRVVSVTKGPVYVPYQPDQDVKKDQ